MANRKTPAAARDTEKMIRQLSLIAYLMSSGGHVEAESIRMNVEGYGDDMSWEAFTRALHRDRKELSRLGIDIRHKRDEFRDCEVYWLPPENYFLPAVEFSRRELAALGTCLSLLDGQFAYSRLLRLALTGLALGTGNSLEEPDAGCYAVDLSSSGYDSTVASHLKTIENAYSKKKTIVFDYHALSRGKTETRTVDPYRIMVTRGDWYLVGYSHERSGIRIFKLRRIRGRIRMKGKSEQNYDIPADFRIQDYLSLEPWQLGPARGEALIDFSPRKGWWAENHLSHCGSVQMAADGSAAVRTNFSDPVPLCALVLGMHGDAKLKEPPVLRRKMVAILKKIEKAHTGSPPALAPEEGRPASAESGHHGRDGDTPQVAPERFAEMATVIAYLVSRLDDDLTAVISVDEAMRDLGFESRREFEEAMDLIKLVNFTAGGYVLFPEVKEEELRLEGWPEGEALGKPANLSPREARALLLAIDLVGGQILGGLYDSLESARQKILKAAGGLDECDAIAVGETEKEDFNICRVLNRGVEEHRLVEIEYLTQGAAAPQARRVEPYLLSRSKGQWYMVAWCLERGAIRTFRFEMIRSATLLDDEFIPRSPDTIDLERYTRDPRFPSGKEAPHVAEVWFAPELSRWVREKQNGVAELADGTLLGHIPYFNEGWLIDEILSYGGEAVLISPPALRTRLAETAAGLKTVYEED